MKADIIILAAGEGKRMLSQRAKVMHELAGQPMLGHVLDTARALPAEKIAVVIGPQADEVKDFLQHEQGNISIFIQEQRLGTGHAVKTAQDFYKNNINNILILFGDTPLIDCASLQKMDVCLNNGADVVVLGFEVDDPKGYGRLITEQDKLIAIHEDKDINPEESAIRICNAGVMGFRSGILDKLMDSLTNNNSQGEYYLTQCVELANDAGLSVKFIIGPSTCAIGVNNQAQLSDAEFIFQSTARQKAMGNGVTLISPETVHFAYDTRIDSDVVIEPYVVFGKKVQIAQGARICSFSHLEGVTIGCNATIGPFARLRPKTVLEKNTKIGNFVEIKAAHVGEGSKINHLSYIGDTDIGINTNIGAGTITCNYDSVSKHKTILGDNVFVGSNSLFVAPLSVGNEAYIATGSVITDDVPAHALAIGRNHQTNKLNYAKKLKARFKSKEQE